MQLTLAVIPVCFLTDDTRTADLLVRIAPPLDLVLAIDTSGSMSGLPLGLARQAAGQVFRQRGDTRLGLVTFALNALTRLRAGGSTALHAVWQLADSMLSAPLVQEPQPFHRLQRVLLHVRAKAGDTVRLRLAWTDSSGQRCALQAEEILPRFGGSETPAEQPEVAALRARLELARTQRRVAELVGHGRLLKSRGRLSVARWRALDLQARGIGVGVDDGQLERLEASLRRGDRQVTSKLDRSEAYLSSSGRKKA